MKLRIKFPFRLNQALEQKLEENHSEDIKIRCAESMYPVSPAAKNFYYYSYKNGSNILADVYYCGLCGDLLINKAGSGTNIFIRHTKHSCAVSYVFMSKTQFAELLVKILALAGKNVNKTQIVAALSDSDVVAADNV